MKFRKKRRVQRRPSMGYASRRLVDTAVGAAQVGIGLGAMQTTYAMFKK
jgi:hypothetical protein